MPWLQLRFDFDSTAIQPRYDHSETYRNSFIFIIIFKLLLYLSHMFISLGVIDEW